MRFVAFAILAVGLLTGGLTATVAGEPLIGSMAPGSRTDVVTGPTGATEALADLRGSGADWLVRTMPGCHPPGHE